MSSSASGITLRKTEDEEKRRGFRNPLATKRAVERRYALNIDGDVRVTSTCERQPRGRVFLAEKLEVKQQIANR